jgi:hypothetical protein
MDRDTAPARAALIADMAIVKRPTVPGFVWVYRFDEGGQVQPLAENQPIDLAEPGEGFRRLHLNLVDQRACQWLASHPALPAAAREIMTSPGHHQSW